MTTDEFNAPIWHCLISRTTGQLWTDESLFAQNGELCRGGTVCLYRSRAAAERAAVAFRKIRPLMLIEAIVLPAQVPEDESGVGEPSELAAIQLDIAMRGISGHSIAHVEIRPHGVRNADFARILQSVFNVALTEDKFSAMVVDHTRTIHLGTVPEMENAK